MSTIFKNASLLTVAATFLTVTFGALGSGAAAQDQTLNGAAVSKTEILSRSATPGFSSLEPAAKADGQSDTDTSADGTSLARAPVDGETLAAAVASQPQVAELSSDLRCLATAIYHEAGHRGLDGQLAVGRVIIARTKSGRFPTSYCGVVMQRSQFSFVRHHRLPHIDAKSKYWKNAVAVAEIAHEGRLQSRAEGALFFHSATINPRWKRSRIAEVDGNVFYH